MEMVYDAPPGIEVEFSQSEFTLPAGEQEKIYITIRVSEDALPGDYEVIARVKAAALEAPGTTGAAIITSAGQKATLTVTGESAQVRIMVLSPAGDPVVAQVRLFKIVEGKDYEFGYSETGLLEAKVSPGQYTASAYVAEEKLAKESFQVAANEEKDVTLTVETVFFEGFGVLPSYREGTKELVFAKVVYTLNNLYKPLSDAEIVLQVSLDGVPLEEISLTSMSRLDVGTVGLSYNYASAKGWEGGSYGFKLELLVAGKSYTTTLEAKLDVGAPSAPAAVLEEINWPLVGGIAGGVVILVLIVFFLVRRRA